MKDHSSCSDIFDKHNDLNEVSVGFKPYEIHKQSDISIDMNISNCFWPTPPSPSCGIGCFEDDLLLILLVVLLIRYLNKKGHES
jgi:hypothetical protein